MKLCSACDAELRNYLAKYLGTYVKRIHRFSNNSLIVSSVRKFRKFCKTLQVYFSLHDLQRSIRLAECACMGRGTAK